MASQNLASEVSTTQSAEFFGRFGRFGGTLKQLAALQGDDDLMKKWVQLIPGLLDEMEKNPFEQTVEAQLAALRRANDEEKWGIAEEDFVRLASTAPAWPEGKRAYRSLRIRFGEGDDGVALTFERHVARIKSVFTEKGFWRWELLLSGKVEYEGKPVERLRLLNGNHTHKPVIEWVVADLDAHRKRDSITAVRGSKSLADELLVIAWLFPDMIRAIDYKERPGLFAAGYKVNVPGHDGEAWQYVVLVYFSRDSRQVSVSAGVRGIAVSGYSVPALRE